MPSILFILLSFLGPAIGVLVIIILFRPAFRALTVPRAVRRRQAVCGTCRHLVADPIPERCPECGTPYLLGGVLTRSLAARTRESTGFFVVAWTLLAIALISVLWPIASHVTERFTGTLTAASGNDGLQPIRPNEWDRDPNTDYQLYDAEFEYDVAMIRPQFGNPNSVGYDVKAGEYTLTISPDTGPRATVRWDARTGAWAAETASGTSDGEAIDRGVFEMLYRDASLDPAHPYVARELDELAQLVIVLETSPGRILRNNSRMLEEALYPDRDRNEWIHNSDAIEQAAKPWNGGLSSWHLGDVMRGSGEFRHRSDYEEDLRDFELSVEAESINSSFSFSKVEYVFTPDAGWPVSLVIHADGSWSVTADPDNPPGTGTRVNEATWTTLQTALAESRIEIPTDRMRSLEAIYTAAPRDIAMWRAPSENGASAHDRDDGGFEFWGGSSSSGGPYTPGADYIPPGFIAGASAAACVALAWLVGGVFALRRRKRLLNPTA